MFYKILRWARIIKPATDNKQFLTQQITYLGKVCDSVIAYPYGMLANAPDDTLALSMIVQNDDSNRVSFAIDSKNRIQLGNGEVAFYHPGTQSYLIYRENGDLDIEAGQGSANININGNVNITGNFSVTGTMTNNGKDVGDTHGHTQSNDSGGDAEQPISGVT